MASKSLHNATEKSLSWKGKLNAMYESISKEDIRIELSGELPHSFDSTRDLAVAVYQAMESAGSTRTCSSASRKVKVQR